LHPFSCIASGASDQRCALASASKVTVKRLLVLIVEVEQPEGLSSRKLIVESMKHNVVTAFSGAEAMELLTRVRPDIVLLHSNLRSPTCEELLQMIRERHADMPLAVMSPSNSRCSTEDYLVSSLEPAQLVGFFKDFSMQVVGAQPLEHSSTRTVSADALEFAR
jgi:chemotaxis response regulator CheB